MKPGEFVKRWTPEEVNFLRTHNDSLTYQEISEKLGRTRSAVQTKAQEIGVRKSKEFINRKAQISQFKPGHVTVVVGRIYANAWKEHEYQYLIDNYETKTCTEIAEVLNRTPAAVKTVAGKVLKLKKSDEAKRLIAKRSNAGQFSAGRLPINTQHDFAISTRSTRGVKSKWIRIALNKWQQLHHYNWLKAGNEIPKGFLLRFKDGNPLNCEAENLYLVQRGCHSHDNRVKKVKLRPARRVSPKLEQAAPAPAKTRPAKRITAKAKPKEILKPRVITKVSSQKPAAKANERQDFLKLKKIEEKRQASKAKERNRILLEQEENRRYATRIIDYSQLVPLKVNAKTTIYIRPDQDPEQARQKWINKYSNVKH